MALTHTPDAELLAPCPDFALPGVDGKIHKLDDYASTKALLVMFICNHCPYVKAVDDRLVALAHRVQPLGASVIAINANDAESYPEDSFANMKILSEKKKYPFHYLYDETQAVAKKFAAVCTPDFFLYNAERVLVYRGRLDDSWKDSTQVRTQDLQDAILDVLAGKMPKAEQKSSMGCSIKWKK